ncbi:hypothetical protein CDEST_05231 [Colletotrichum destructivum]|uniref:Uncharacterized protein n=1 Tax=Colletotrichum destructivum TaxID=34406 RepID=A0AAX4I9Z1_9PEZI|nr:hypothetical protein CDEST_05231 [Colletotrichum destructivum]
MTKMIPHGPRLAFCLEAMSQAFAGVSGRNVASSLLIRAGHVARRHSEGDATELRVILTGTVVHGPTGNYDS